MKTHKELVQASLADLSKRIVSEQIALKLVQSDKTEVFDELMDLEAYEEHLKSIIKGLKDKASWEIREYEKLHGVAVKDGKVTKKKNDGQLPEPPRLEGDEWKNG
jgi:hypothetical protein